MFSYEKMIDRLRNGWNNNMFVDYLIMQIGGEKRTMQVAFLETEVNDLHEMVNQAILVDNEDNLIVHFKLRVAMDSLDIEGWAMAIGGADLPCSFDYDGLGKPTEREFVRAYLTRD